MKIGRNDKCPCGSGKKYKRCCIGQEQLILQRMMQRMKTPESISESGKLVGRPVIATHFKDKRVIAVGSRLYTSLPPNITFHEFLITFLKDIVGMDWGRIENEKPQNQQHIIIQWIHEMAMLLNSAETVVMKRSDGDIKSTKVTGNVQSLLALAYDIYSVYHCAELPSELINRFKNMDQFQGARYEIAVAATFARAGFNIDWISETGEKRCEFIATHKITNEIIIVEAKSRHREGVLGRPGVRENLTTMRSQVGRLFNAALEKPTKNLPFMIFIDINLPLNPRNKDLSMRWIKDIKKMLDKHPTSTPTSPDPFTTLFITNFSWHYHEQSTAISRGENIVIIPLYPKIKTKDPGIVSLLNEAILQYGSVPSHFPPDIS